MFENFDFDREILILNIFNLLNFLFYYLLYFIYQIKVYFYLNFLILIRQLTFYVKYLNHFCLLIYSFIFSYLLINSIIKYQINI